MAEEGKGIALAILGVVAVIAVVGLILLFTGATGQVVFQQDKLYGGGGIAHNQDQYNDPQGYIRNSDNRIYAGALYGDQWSDDFRSRNQDSGDSDIPYATYNVDYKRTGPVRDNPCPYAPYSDKVTELYARGRDCVASGYNPNNGEMGRIPAGYEDFLCCA